MVQIGLIDLEADIGLALNDLQVLDMYVLTFSFFAKQHALKLLHRVFDLAGPILPLRMTAVATLRVADHYFFRQLILVVLSSA